MTCACSDNVDLPSVSLSPFLTIFPSLPLHSPLSFADQRVVEQLLSELYVEALVMGNATADEAKGLMQQLQR